jgi:AraC family transcriptional regulator
MLRKRPLVMDMRVERAINTMQQSLLRLLSIETLSKSVNLSPSRLRQLFKKETGCSPIQYVKALRMQHAEQLLRKTFLSIKEVAFLCGGKDVSYFVREFKKQYGLTPTEFRARIQSSPENTPQTSPLAISPTNCRLRRSIRIEEKMSGS